MLQRLTPNSRDQGRPGHIRPLPSKRRPTMMVAGLALTALGALVAWEVYGVAGHQTPVLVMARDVPVGQRLQPQDLRVVGMGIDPAVQSVDASNKSAIVGSWAAVDLKAGSLLAPGQIAKSLVPNSGQVVVPLALKPSQLPARGIRPGDRVVVTAVSSETQTSAGQGRWPVDHPGYVDRIGPPDADGLIVVDLVVPATDGTTLARQAATGKVAIVLKSRAG